MPRCCWRCSGSGCSRASAPSWWCPLRIWFAGVLPPLGYILGYLHPLYFGMLAARVLGLFVFEHGAELGR
jgi:hypothetical protein